MHGKKAKLLLFSAAGVLLFLGLWLGVHGINRTVDRTVGVEVYQGADRSAIASSVNLSGNLRKTLFSASYVGTFAIAYDEPTCRDGVEARIDWQDGYETISFFHAGDFSRLDVQSIEIDEEMDSMMIVLNDGTIIATQDAYLPAGV